MTHYTSFYPHAPLQLLGQPRQGELALRLASYP